MRDSQSMTSSLPLPDDSLPRIPSQQPSDHPATGSNGATQTLADPTPHESDPHFENCWRLAGLNPYTWMLDWLAACARNGNQAPQELAAWLPWRLSEQRREQLSKAPTEWIPPVTNSPDCELDKAA